MKEYMLIYLGGDPEWKANTPEDVMMASMERWGQWMDKLQAKDQLVTGGSPLHYGGKRLDPNLLVTDITAAEFKELVSGYSIVKAADFDQAVAIAKECPIFEYPGISVEIREVMQMG